MAPEDPWDAWRRRHVGSDLPAFFADFEKEFARMQGMVEKIMEDAMKHASGPRREQPFVYGFSMRVGKDGIPQIQPFGSAAPFTAEALSGDEVREPLTDVVESDKEVAVTVELPGVEKQDVNLHVAEDAVTVKVEKGRKYHKRISLPAKVVPPTAKATFKNGILDVTVARRSDADSGHKVSIQ